MAAKNTTKRSGATKTKSTATKRKPKAAPAVKPTQATEVAQNPQGVGTASGTDVKPAETVTTVAPAAAPEKAPEPAPVVATPAETQEPAQTAQNETQVATVAVILLEDIEVKDANGDILSIPAESVAFDTGARQGELWRVVFLDFEYMGAVGIPGSLLLPAPANWEQTEAQVQDSSDPEDGSGEIKPGDLLCISPNLDCGEIKPGELMSIRVSGDDSVKTLSFTDLQSFSAFGAAFILARMMKMRGKPGHRDAQSTLVDPDNSERWSASICPETNDLMIEHEPNAYGEIDATAAVDKASRALAVALRDRSAIQAAIDAEEEQYTQEFSLANRVGSQLPDEAEFERKMKAYAKDAKNADEAIVGLRNTMAAAKLELAAHVRSHYRFPEGEYQVMICRAAG